MKNTATHPTAHRTRRLGLIIGTTLAASTLLVGCGDGGDAATPTEETQSTAPLKEIVITGNDQMQFSQNDFKVSPGQQVKVLFKNVGTMPKESMGHNWVLLKDTADTAKFVEDGFASASNDYISPEHEGDVIKHTKILGPGESATVVFTAPTKPGPYDYVCTFPGHFAVGMKGVMTVE